MKTNFVTQAVRFALVAGAATAFAAPAVFAQDSTQGAANQNQNPNANTAQLGKIEVTGTRIKRTDVETAQPVTIVTAAQIKASGLTSIGDVLQQLSSSGASFNTQFNNGGTGATFIDLRNLGPNRTLVLLNGQRVDAGVAGSVDLNNIPVSIVDHIEVLQDGASAIYGSDAISGVVNIITVKNYNGAEANAYLGMFDGKNDGGGWDGKQQEYDFTIGSSGDRAGVLLNVTYVNQSPMFAGNRTISKEPVIGGGASSGSSGSAAGRFFIGIPKGTTCPAGVTTNVNPFSTTCDMSLINTPDNNPSLSNFRDFQNSDHFNFAPLNYLVTPSERTSLYVQGHYDIADNLTFNTMAIYNDRVSQQQLAPAPLFLGRSGTSVVNGQPIVISGKNPYNPFGVDLTGGNTGTAATCAANDNCDVLQFLGRRPLELGNRVFNQDTTSFAFRGGFTGYFNLLGNEWDWDVSYNYGKNYGSGLEVTNGGVTSGEVNLVNLQNALGNPGEAPCQISATNTGTLAGCVPLNIFGGYNLATGQGSITPAMANYILFEEHDVTSETMRDYTANITGNLFNLPAGPVGVALGAEALEHDALEHPDAIVESGNSSGTKTQPTNGRENTKAEYIEFNIPLVTDVPFMENVSLDIADRWSQFKWAGGNAAVPGTGVEHSAANTSGRAALRWQATDALLLRGSWSQGFRIPSVSEFFLGNGDSFPTLTDPCVTGVGSPAFCPAAAKQPNAQIRTTVGGNPNLTPERSISRTVGFVYSPDWLPGFDFSADYFKIELLNAVSVIGGQSIMNGCYIGGNLNFCKLITRAGGTQGNYNTSGSITDILNTNVNIGGVKTEGVDVITDYKFPSTAVGDFKASLNVTFVKQYVATVPFGTGALSSQEMSGTTSQSSINVPFSTGASGVVGGIPKQRANFALNWNYGDWSAVWNVQYISHLIEDCNALNATAPGVAAQLIATRCTTQSFSFPFDSSAVVPVNHIGATTYHDVAATYHLDSWNTDFTFGIRNLFDKEPPIAMSAFANSFLPTLYRAPGRFF
ncbi:MAG TPA: TonB-dependent receptor, partial [Candidatus Saccharimonadales bacterium]|nr:TonB-dependent receptor [Candidatus Saccharimonadales bacterium]